VCEINNKSGFTRWFEVTHDFIIRSLPTINQLSEQRYLSMRRISNANLPPDGTTVYEVWSFLLWPVVFGICVAWDIVGASVNRFHSCQSHLRHTSGPAKRQTAFFQYWTHGFCGNWTICGNTARCSTSAEKETTDLGWCRYPLTFFGQYRYGNLARFANGQSAVIQLAEWLNCRLGNSLDELRHTCCLVLLNKHQISGGGVT